MDNEISDQVEGRNSVLELLESDNDINKLYIQSGEKHGAIIKIIAKAKEKKIVISEIDKNKLDQMSETHNHQGVIAIVPPYNYSSVEEILELAKSKNEKPFVIICDGIEDPHNLGSIIRTAECVGAHGVIIPKRRSAAVNATVNKTSAGAVAYVKVARVTNLNDTIKELQDNGVWIYGTDMDGTSNYNEVKYDSGVGIVVGSEGFGMSRLVKENCDFLVRIPMAGKINSLNASVSASIVMYEVMNQRKNS
jgi:23S rRNA (guanosine2251-2'-O)-methyltransferase